MAEAVSKAIFDAVHELGSRQPPSRKPLAGKKNKLCTVKCTDELEIKNLF